MSRLGVFGGSFDPPHRAHRAVAEAAVDHLGLDRLLWIPARRPPHKPDRTLSDDTHRLAMLELVTSGNARFSVDRRELERSGPSFTVDTLESLRSDYPDADLYLIVGEDNLAGFVSWKHPERIRELATLVVYRRPGSTVHDLDGAIELPGPTWPLSSTDIRQRIASGQHPKDLVEAPVLAYIRSHGLYLPA